MHTGQGGSCALKRGQSSSGSEEVGHHPAAQSLHQLEGAPCRLAAQPQQGGQGCCSVAQQSSGVCLAAVAGQCHLPAGAPHPPLWRSRSVLPCCPAVAHLAKRLTTEVLVSLLSLGPNLPGLLPYGVIGPWPQQWQADPICQRHVGIIFPCGVVSECSRVWSLCWHCRD